MKNIVKLLALIFLGVIDYYIWINLNSLMSTSVLIGVLAFNILFLWVIVSAKTKEDALAQPQSVLNKRINFWIAIPGLFIIGCGFVYFMFGLGWTCAFSGGGNCGELEVFYIKSGSIAAAIIIILISIKWRRN